MGGLWSGSGLVRNPVPWSDDCVDAEEQEVVEVVVDEQGGQHGHGEAEVVLLRSVARLCVEQHHEAAQGQVKHSAGSS